MHICTIDCTKLVDTLIKHYCFDYAAISRFPKVNLVKFYDLPLTSFFGSVIACCVLWLITSLLFIHVIAMSRPHSCFSLDTFCLRTNEN